MMRSISKKENGGRKSRSGRILLTGLGVLFTITGIIGIVVPVLPTTVFFIMAGGVFIKSSPAMYRWLHNNRITGSYLRVYTLGEGLSGPAKARSLILLWMTLLVSAWFVRAIAWLLPVLFLVGVGVSWHVLTIKSRVISPEKRAAHERIMKGGSESPLPYKEEVI